MKEKFDESYYMRGKETGQSNYENYRWLPDQTISMAGRIAQFVGMIQGESIFDFGCARGYLVKAFRVLGFRSWGYDISDWAIKNCDPEIVPYVTNLMTWAKPTNDDFDWCIAKDVLEHIQHQDIQIAVTRLIQRAKRGVLIVVPLRDPSQPGARYVAPQDNCDATHQICWTFDEWMGKLLEFASQYAALTNPTIAPFNYAVSGAYKLPGVKQACDPYPKSVGFFTIRRII
jgi:cyclopropane fatty-acyl-phospholipid synthase-like methyltransferase